MKYMAAPDYSLRYDWRGREKERNNFSRMLTGMDIKIDGVNESLSPQLQSIHEAIEISRKHRYDLDISFSYGWFKIIIYRKPGMQFNLTPLIPVFAKAKWTSIDDYGRGVKLTANYIFNPKMSRE